MVKKINKSLRILSTTKRSKERNKFLKSNQIFKEIWRKKKEKKSKKMDNSNNNKKSAEKSFLSVLKYR